MTLVYILSRNMADLGVRIYMYIADIKRLFLLFQKFIKEIQKELFPMIQLFPC